MNTDWHELKENIYFEDGSFRDIYAFDINIEDWKNWVVFVNQTYEVEFVYGEASQTVSSIEFSTVKDFWFDKDKFVNLSIIKVGGLNINCHFFK